jgi:hypothetical protein
MRSLRETELIRNNRPSATMDVTGRDYETFILKKEIYKETSRNCYLRRFRQ